jgi:hypothetical protein
VERQLQFRHTCASRIQAWIRGVLTRRSLLQSHQVGLGCYFCSCPVHLTKSR